MTLRGVGTTATAMTTGSETGPAAGKVWNIPRLYITNVTAGAILATVEHRYLGPTDTSICEGFPLAAKGDQAATLILENIVLVNGDSIMITSGTAASIDAYCSVLEEDA